METTNIIPIDPIPKLCVTPKFEQTFVLLLAFHNLGKVASGDELFANIQTKGYWRGSWPDFPAVWGKLIEKNNFIRKINGESYGLSQKGLAQLHDLSILVFALRDAFKHLTTSAYFAACDVKEEIKRLAFTSRAVSQIQPQMRRKEFHVYVILLQAEALEIYPHLINSNPKRRTNYPCLYVGYTGKTPEIRFKQHKNGRKASEMVKRFGICLVPDLYAHMNPIKSYQQAIAMERDFAAGLRQHGYTVSAGHHDWAVQK